MEGDYLRRDHFRKDDVKKKPQLIRLMTALSHRDVLMTALSYHWHMTK